MTKKRNLTYKNALAEIEEIITEIESETVDVDMLAEKVHRAAELIKFCKEKLTRTEQEVSKVLQKFEEDEKEVKNSDELF